MRWLIAISLCICWTCWAVASGSAEATASSAAICSLPPKSYAGAKEANPKYAEALTALEKRGIATWYSDRTVNGDSLGTVKDLVKHCDDSTRLSIVVYALPNKDCEAGYSSKGSTVQTAEDYSMFIDSLVTVVGKRKVIYVLEPDAVGLLVNSGCAIDAKYKENLLVAVDKLTASNTNAEIYVDVGFWTLFEDWKAAKVADIVKELAKAGNGRVKGITLNTSNYRPTKEMAGLCTKFQTAYKSTDLHCIIDTSRNYNETSSEEWCNRRTGGIGHPPTSDTGIANIDYFVWIKPPGESDGECNSGDHTKDAMVGPEAGVFFPKQFELLWNNGYLHKVDKMAGINLPASGSSVGATAIVVLCVIAIIAIVFIAFMVHRRRKGKQLAEMRSRAYYA